VKIKQILALSRDCEQRSTQARQQFEKTGDPAHLEEVRKAETALDRLALMDPDDK
jgi:hypothetical protein